MSNSEPTYPCGTKQVDIVNNSIESYVDAMRTFLEADTIPTFDSSFELEDDVNDLSLEGLQELIEDLKAYEGDVLAFTEDHNLPPAMTLADIRDASGKYIVQGEVYEDVYQWLDSSFLDFAYHRVHDDVNVLQCLTHWGGPGGGFWIESDGSILYWTAWWGPVTAVYLRGEDLRIATAFFEMVFEICKFSWQSDDCEFEFHGTGFRAGLEMLQTVERARMSETACS